MTVGRKKVEETFRCEQSIFYGKEKDDLKEETRNQGPKQKTMENHSQEREQLKKLAT